MIKKEVLCLVICLLPCFGCAASAPSVPSVETEITNQIIIASAKERTVFIQTDPAIAETAQIVRPLEKELEAKGYRIVSTPKQAGYTLRLELPYFGLRGRPPAAQSAKPAKVSEGNASEEPTKAERASGQSAPGAGSAAGFGSAIGTAAGSAASTGNVFRTTSAGGSAGGLIGFGAGMVLGGLLKSEGTTEGRNEPFIGKIIVSIGDSNKEKPPQQTELTARATVPRINQEPKVREAVAAKLAAQIAAMMP
jgi:hypothetical protein